MAFLMRLHCLDIFSSVSSNFCRTVCCFSWKFFVFVHTIITLVEFVLEILKKVEVIIKWWWSYLKCHKLIPIYCCAENWCTGKYRQLIYAEENCTFLDINLSLHSVKIPNNNSYRPLILNKFILLYRIASIYMNQWNIEEWLN